MRMGAGTSRMEYYPMTSPRPVSGRTRPTPRPASGNRPALPKPVRLSAVSLHATTNSAVNTANEIPATQYNTNTDRHTHIQHSMSKKQRSTPTKNRPTPLWTPSKQNTGAHTTATSRGNDRANHRAGSPEQNNGTVNSKKHVWTPRLHSNTFNLDDEVNATGDNGTGTWTPRPYNSNDRISNLIEPDTTHTVTNGIDAGDDDALSPCQDRDNGAGAMSNYSPDIGRGEMSKLSTGSWKSGRPPPPTARPTQNTAKHKQSTHHHPPQTSLKDSWLKHSTADVNNEKRQKRSEAGSKSKHVDRWVNPAYTTNGTASPYNKGIYRLQADPMKRYASPSASRIVGTTGTRQWTFSAEWF